jgi:general stress protein CsbA
MDPWSAVHLLGSLTLVLVLYWRTTLNHYMCAALTAVLGVVWELLDLVYCLLPLGSSLDWLLDPSGFSCNDIFMDIVGVAIGWLVIYGWEDV